MFDLTGDNVQLRTTRTLTVSPELLQADACPGPRTFHWQSSNHET